MENLGLKTMSTFSLSHLIYMGIAVVLVALLSLILLKASDKAKRGVVFAFSLLGFLVLIATAVYGYLTIENFDILANLPLGICGIGFIFGMIFSLTKVEAMKSFVGYVGIFGGLYGLLALPTAIVGSASFDLQVVLYFIPYILLFVVGLLMFILKVARPTYKNMGISIITLILVAVFIHVLNAVFILYGVSESANYLITLFPARDVVAEFVFEYIPASFVYLFAYLVAFVILSSIVSLFSLIGNKKVETYEIEDIKEKKEKPEKVKKEKKEKPVKEEKEETEKQVVKTEVEEVVETEAHLGLPMEEGAGENKDEWEDVIPESVLEAQAKKEETADDIIIKDEDVEPKQEKAEEKPNVLFEPTKKIEEKKEVSSEPKISNRNIEKNYETYEIKEKPTQVQRKYSFAEADRKRKNDPTLGVSSTKRSASQNTELLKDLRTRINNLGKK